ncbi:MAG: hypothetical protein WC582_02490 [Patescibacteria group bacterium]|jgi:hypothetical protein
MKKSVLFVAILVIVAMLSGCKKSETPEPEFAQTQVQTPKEKVKIFISRGEKSGSIQIAAGDTVSSPIDINNFMYAEDLFGQPLKGNWEIIQEVSDNPDNYQSTSAQNSYNGDQIAHRFEEYGLYKVIFGKFVNWQTTDTLMVFYIAVNGIPGKVGDGPQDNSIFRMEKKELYAAGGGFEKIFFVYFKYEAPITENQAYLNLLSFVDGVAGYYNFYCIKAKKWPLSNSTVGTYYYFVMNSDTLSNNISYYKACYLISNDGGFSGMVDANTYVSSWTNGLDGIEFSLNQ